jgi:hypothetical protein
VDGSSWVVRSNLLRCYIVLGGHGSSTVQIYSNCQTGQVTLTPSASLAPLEHTAPFPNHPEYFSSDSAYMVFFYPTDLLVCRRERMADVAKAPSAVDGSTHKTRPEKPDQAKYEADLAAAQKEHAANMEKLVCLPFVT